MKALSAEAILSLAEPECLFSGPGTIKDEHRALAKRWHPDHNADRRATEVVAQINRLYDEAQRRVASGTWQTPGLLELEGVDGKVRRIRYRRKHAFELGEFVYGDTALAFVVRGEFADLFENGRKRIAGLKYRDAAMDKEMSRFLPKVQAVFETKDGRSVMVQEKTPDVFLLRDVLAALNGKIDAKHVAWVQSAMHNIACYLEFAGLTHNGIGIDTVFVSPQFHSALLLGGWWYAAPFGSRLNAVPAATHAHAPMDILRDKRAQYRLDLAMLRVTGRQLLGDASGMMLAGSDAPAPMRDFLRRPTTGSAREDYALWASTVLPASFGPRRFVKLDLSASDIYQER